MAGVFIKKTLAPTLNVIVSYSLMRRVFLPHQIMLYAYTMIRQGVIEDSWKDWILFWRIPYSERIDRDLYYLHLKGYLKKVCIENICGFYKLTKKPLTLLKQTTS